MAQHEQNNGTFFLSSENHQNQDGALTSKALQIELVLEKIASFLSKQDLLTFRRVNKAWNRSCLSTLRRKTGSMDFSSKNFEYYNYSCILFPSRFLSSIYLYKSPWNIDRSKQHSLIIDCVSGVTSILQSGGDTFPYSKFEFDAPLTLTAAEDTVLDSLLQAISGFVTELTFERQSSCRMFHRNPNLHIEFPKLKTLTITSEFDCYQRNRNEEYNKTQDMNFFRNLKAPNLQNLKLFITPDESFTLLYFDAIDQQQWQRIQNLEISGFPTNLHFRKLSQLGLALRELILYCNTYQPLEFSAAFTRFLESQSGTLQTLKFRCQPERPNHQAIEIAFPCMPKLRYLEIKNSCLPVLSRWWIFRNISYATQFPVLKKLKIEINPECLNNFFTHRMQPQKILEELELPAELTDPNVIVQAGRIFPNIKKLRAPDWMNIMQTVNTEMRNIEELKLYIVSQEAEYHQVFTGYTLSELKEIEKSEEGMPSARLTENKEPLSFLHNLKVLKLHSFNQAQTNVLFYKLGLMKLKSLRRLEVPGLYINACLTELKQKCDVFCAFF